MTISISSIFETMKCKYRIRCVSSKGAYLVLVWTLFTFALSTSLLILMRNVAIHTMYWLIKGIPIVTVLVLVSAPLSGWLADAKFGNYKVFRFGAVLLFISMVANCILLTLETLVSEGSHVLKLINMCLTGSLFVVSLSACVVTALRKRSKRKFME